jgi:hypothetical protein
MNYRELLPIPPIETANDPVHSAADLRQRWRALVGPLGFEERLLWFGLIGPDRCFTKKLSQVQIRPRPQGRIIWNLMSALRTLLDDLGPRTTVALLLPGPVVDRLPRLTGCGRRRSPTWPKGSLCRWNRSSAPTTTPSSWLVSKTEGCVRT